MIFSDNNNYKIIINAICYDFMVNTKSKNKKKRKAWENSLVNKTFSITKSSCFTTTDICLSDNEGYLVVSFIED